MSDLDSSGELGSTRGPGVVVLHGSSASAGLVDELARVMASVGVTRITCAGSEITQSSKRRIGAAQLHMLPLDVPLGSDAYVEALVELDIVHAHAVIVLPRAGVDEPDSGSRITCVAIRRACGDRVGPNLLVEIEDPEAAFEFVGLGVASVFYPGHLRAALLGQACVDLGVFQFIIGLLRGRHHVRSIPVPEQQRSGCFADAALSLEHDDVGRPMTVIGVAKGRSESGQPIDIVVNPGPRTPLREVVCLMVLVSGETETETRTETQTGAYT